MSNKRISKRAKQTQCRKSALKCVYIPSYTFISVYILSNTFTYHHMPSYTLKYSILEKWSPTKDPKTVLNAVPETLPWPEFDMHVSAILSRVFLHPKDANFNELNDFSRFWKTSQFINLIIAQIYVYVLSDSTVTPSGTKKGSWWKTRNHCNATKKKGSNTTQNKYSIRHTSRKCSRKHTPKMQSKMNTTTITIRARIRG